MTGEILMMEEEKNLTIADRILAVSNTSLMPEGARMICSFPQSRTDPLSIYIDERSVLSNFSKKILLKDIHIKINPGEMVLILGGSGAGKTTFVNAVTGYEKAKASIKSGDVDFYRDYDRVKYRIGFVPQADLLRGEDTVEMTLLNAAQLRMPAGVSEKERVQKVRSVLEQFGLLELASSQVSKLSGGQRKRLSICVEYIADPTLFILDEPDSGLDGVMARELMEHLRKIAGEGKIVMVITHQPDRAADLFDKVVVFAKSGESHAGQLAFYGGISECRRFFGVSTMEQVVREINPMTEGGEGKADLYIAKYRVQQDGADKEQAWKELEASLKEGAKGKEEPPRKSSEDTDGSEARKEGNLAAVVAAALAQKDYGHVGRFGQMLIYLGKLMRLFIFDKNWAVLVMSTLIAYVVCMVVGVDMFRSMERATMGSLAFICVCIWNGFFNSIQMVCKERSIIKREHRAGMHISAYMGAQVVYQILICLLQVGIFILIFYLNGMEFPESGVIIQSNPILDIGVTMFFITFAADMLALMVSCVVRTTTVAMTIVPFLLMVELLFSGVAFTLSGRMAKAADLTVSKWGVNALCAQAHYNELPSTAVWTQLKKVLRTYENGDDVIQMMLEEDYVDALEYQAAKAMQKTQYDSTPENVMRCWEILLAHAAVYILIGTVSLEFVDKDKR